MQNMLSMCKKLWLVIGKWANFTLDWFHNKIEEFEEITWMLVERIGSWTLTVTNATNKLHESEARPIRRDFTFSTWPCWNSEFSTDLGFRL